MGHPLQDLVGTINNQLLRDKGLRDLFNVVGGNHLDKNCGDTRLAMFAHHREIGCLLVDLRNSENGAFIRLSGRLPEVSLDKVIKYEGSEDDVRRMVNDMVKNLRPVKVSLG